MHINHRMTPLYFALPLLLWATMAITPAFAGPESLFEDAFNRPDSADPGNGWQTVPNPIPCKTTQQAAAKVQDRTFFPEERNKPSQPPPTPDPVAPLPQAGPLPPGPATVQIREGTLFLSYNHGTAAHAVRRDINKKITRLVYDFTPLYAMGGLDDRAWLGVTLQYLDQENKLLGEIRNVHYNAVYDPFSNSDTIHSLIAKGPFDGGTRHAVVDADTILNQNLHHLLHIYHRT